jgi:RNA polymerase sigma-70 factor (ECF subfamily)
MNHEQLIEACKTGDSKAQIKIYKLYYKAMYNISFRMLNHTADAEDIMQESFLIAFQKIHTYRGEVSFGAWLKRIVINKSLDHIKAGKALISLESIPEIPDEVDGPEYLEYRDIQPEMVNQAISLLPEGYRVVLSLYLIEGYDHEEIAEILQITNATSRTQYHRAKKLLAQRLTELKAVS